MTTVTVHRVLQSCGLLAALLAVSLLVSDLSAQERRGGRRGAPGQTQPSRPATQAKTEIKPALTQEIADKVTWRSIGPANMRGRITAIAVYEKDPAIWWAASASGGLAENDQQRHHVRAPI